jgi:hypothetical protein
LRKSSPEIRFSGGYKNTNEEKMVVYKAAYAEWKEWSDLNKEEIAKNKIEIIRGKKMDKVKKLQTQIDKLNIEINEE